MSHPFEEYRDTLLWHTVAEAVTELEATREVAIATAPDYVIGYLCERLAAAHLATPKALAYAP